MADRPIHHPENFRFVWQNRLAISGRPTTPEQIQFLKRHNFALFGDFSPREQRLLADEKLPFQHTDSLRSHLEDATPVKNINEFLNSVHHLWQHSPHRILICCHAGETLSPTLAALFLNEKLHVPINDAFKAVRPLTARHDMEIQKTWAMYQQGLLDRTPRTVSDATLQKPETTPLVFGRQVRHEKRGMGPINPKPPRWPSSRSNQRKRR